VLSSTPDGLAGPEPGQTRKSEVLQTAIDYVNQSQLEMRHMTNDINRLTARVKTLEKLVKCEDCNLLKGFNGLKVIRKHSSNGIDAIDAPQGATITSAG